MKIAILGGGITGLTAAYTLSKEGHEIVIYEAEETLGGLARGFYHDGWEWPLEKAYHHIFANDTDIIQFAQEIGFEGIFLQSPTTNSLYKTDKGYEIFPVDSPLNFMQFPLLQMPEKIRGAFFLAVLKFLPMLPLYEKMSSEKFTQTFMGERMWNMFFEQLFRKKFGKYAGNVLASFLWARIHKRTKKLGYMKGGFQAFIDTLTAECTKLGVEIRSGVRVTSLKSVEAKSKSTGIIVDGESYEKVISTLPSKILAKLGSDILPSDYTSRLQDMNYLHARVLVLETDEPILKNTYWLNICTPEVPMMVLAQHTNFIDKKHYNNKHLAYIGYYLEQDDEYMTLSKDALVKRLLPYLKKIDGSNFKLSNVFDFKGPFAQPIFDEKLLANKPDFITPHKDLYIANLDMTYPYDRGTNYAVKLGNQVSKVLMA